MFNQSKMLIFKKSSFRKDRGKGAVKYFDSKVDKKVNNYALIIEVN